MVICDSPGGADLSDAMLRLLADRGKNHELAGQIPSLIERGAVLAAVKTASRFGDGPAASLDTGGEFERCRGAILIRAMTFLCNNDSRQKSNTSLFNPSFFCNRQA